MADLVLVEWLDSHSSSGWFSIDDLKNQCGEVHCSSSGWLLHKQNGYTLIVPHLVRDLETDEPISGRGYLAIPTKAMTKTTILRKGKK